MAQTNSVQPYAIPQTYKKENTGNKLAAQSAGPEPSCSEGSWQRTYSVYDSVEAPATPFPSKLKSPLFSAGYETRVKASSVTHE